MNFMNELESRMQTSVTENGAIGYSTTRNPILDMNFAIASLRNLTESDITEIFNRCLSYDKNYALKWLFYARDIRGGVGERRLFRICFLELLRTNRNYEKLIPYIPEYGRWDDVLYMYPYAKQAVVSLVKTTLLSDIESMKMNNSVSLLAKWMPTETASSQKTQKFARNLASDLNLTPRKYRKIMSSLRAYIKVVERSMSRNEWGDIDYEAVPSKANLIYSDAFLNHDETRRREYLEKLKNGNAKINASALFPYEIIKKYPMFGTHTEDPVIEAMWSSLPEYGIENTLVVCDGSGSMEWNDLGNNIRPIDVAQSMAIYAAERCKGEFKDTFMTFGRRPQLVKISGSLLDKIIKTRSYTDCSNTDIEAVFDLILNVAVKAKMEQLDIPKSILIISDMEFDAARSSNVNEALFESIAKRYNRHGYKIPRLVFWNVGSRTETIPMHSNELGVCLVSGFSTSIVKMVTSDILDPWECLKNQLDSDRYKDICGC